MSRNSRAAFFVTFFSLASCKTNKNLTFLVATTVTTSLLVYIHQIIFSFLTRCLCWFTQCLSTQRSFGFVAYRYRSKVVVLIDKIKFRIIKSTIRSKKFLGNMTPHSFIHKKVLSWRNGTTRTTDVKYYAAPTLASRSTFKPSNIS